MAANPDSTEVGARKSNLAFTFLSLEPERREAMDVFYRFCRETDDIADDPLLPSSDKDVQLELWRSRIRGLYSGTPIDNNPLAESLAPIITRYAIPQQYFFDILNGLKMDVEPRQYSTWRDLQKYCYGVASAVGLICIRIFGCKTPLSEEFALNLGYALQFTNILRDVVEDYTENNRIYLPRDEMERCGVEEHFLADPSRHPQCRRLFYIQYFRARHFFNRARRCIDPADRDALRAALIMARFYEEFLDIIRRRNFILTPKRIRLSKPRKLLLLRKVLRELKKNPPQPLPAPDAVTVLGGGIAGMAAAIELAYQGYTVDLWEAKGFNGGRAHSLVDKQSGLTIDNGQHAVMGCYHSFLRLVERLGTGDRLQRPEALMVPWRDRQQKAYRLAAAPRLAAAHLLAGLVQFNALTWKDRIAIFRLGLKLKSAVPRANETAAAWLTRYHQTPGAIRALWEPFTIAALNEPIESADADLLHETLKRSLFGTPADAALIFAKRGLSDLFEPDFNELLEATGGSVHNGRQVKRFETEGTALRAIFDNRGARIEVGQVVSALPWGAFASLLPEDSPLAAKLKALPPRPIVNIHLLVDRKLFDEPFVGLLDSPFHWVFDRTHTLPESNSSESGNRFLYAITQSAPGEWATRPSQEIIDAARRELEVYFPAAREMSILRSLVIKTNDATFSAQPQFQHLRQSIHSPWDNLTLAGDWTQPDLPATLEAAAESGLKAAERIAATLLP